MLIFYCVSHIRVPKSVVCFFGKENWKANMNIVSSVLHGDGFEATKHEGFMGFQRPFLSGKLSLLEKKYPDTMSSWGWRYASPYFSIYN